MKVFGTTEIGSTTLLRATVIAELIEIPVDPGAGLLIVMVPWLASLSEEVVKELLNGVTVLPSRSRKPLALSV